MARARAVDQNLGGPGPPLLHESGTRAAKHGIVACEPNAAESGAPPDANGGHSMTRDWLLTLLVLVSPFLFVLAALLVALAALQRHSRPRRVAIRRLEPAAAGAAVDVASRPMGRL